MKATEIRKAIGLRREDTKWDANSTYSKIMAAVSVESPVYTAVYGILWADQSCRISGSLRFALFRRMTAWEITELVARVAQECQVIGDVPKWLNAHYDELVKVPPVSHIHQPPQ